MDMVNVDGSGLLAELVGMVAVSLYSSNKPRELWQWLCHDNSTIVVMTSITYPCVRGSSHCVVRFL